MSRKIAGRSRTKLDVASSTSKLLNRTSMDSSTGEMDYFKFGASNLNGKSFNDISISLNSNQNNNLYSGGANTLQNNYSNNSSNLNNNSNFSSQNTINVSNHLSQHNNYLNSATNNNSILNNLNANSI